MKTKKKSYEYIIIGSGFGGAFAAYNLARKGKEVLLIERGNYVSRDDSCWDEQALHLRDHLYRGHTPAIIDQSEKGGTVEEWPNDTVGGMSTFYGAAAYRMRTADFSGAPVSDSEKRDPETAWPINYKSLEPFYDTAEELQQVAGLKKSDITGPHRGQDYPQKLPDTLSPPSKRIWDASKELGLHPYHIPLAINFSGDAEREKCIRCSTCDHYLCKIEAKNDLSVTVLPKAIEHGVEIIPDTRAVCINMKKSEAHSVDIIEQSTGEKQTLKAKNVIVACGALATPQLLLASGVQNIADCSTIIGRFLMRHCNGVFSGLFPFKTNPKNVFHKQVAIPDYYDGNPNSYGHPEGSWGLIQEIHTPGKGVIKSVLPPGIGNIAAFASEYLINLLCIAEDMPRYNNRVFIDEKKTDKFGMPALMVHHRHTHRDITARAALYTKAYEILKKAGAFYTKSMPIETFSHAFGTCRFGSNRISSVLDPECKLWGIKNLYVLDASFMPSGGSVNPSLTIAANALRVTDMMK